MPESATIQQAIARQRKSLEQRIRKPLEALAGRLTTVWGDRQAMDAMLQEGLTTIPDVRFLYALDNRGVQLSDNIGPEGVLEKDFGRDRSHRPYMQQLHPGTDFILSEAYISIRAKRPSLTAMQVVRDDQGRQLGYLGADFDLRQLPLTQEMALYDEPTQWRQIKGDPAIRGTVFHQTRVESEMDRHIDEALGVMDELMVDHGVFHTWIHFSSSRAIIWWIDDPFRYRLLDIHLLTDPDICLAYPLRPYPENAIVPAEKIRPVLDGFRELRFMDETLYLRSGSLNIFNGMVGLTFSCDGSHYLPWDEFLDRSHAFWAGSLGL